MEPRNAVVLFEDVPVRREWRDGEQWIAAVDVAKALEYDNPSRAASKVILRNKERFEGYYKQFTSDKLSAQTGDSGQGRKMYFLNQLGVVAFCMLSNMPKAIPFQRWADKILVKHIQNIPEDIRLVAKQKRVKFTDTLQEHGCNKPYHYSNITKDMKDSLGIDKHKPKDSCDLIEVMKIAVSEDLARINMIQDQSQGYFECHDASILAAKAIEKNTKPTKELPNE